MRVLYCLHLARSSVCLAAAAVVCVGLRLAALAAKLILDCGYTRSLFSKKGGKPCGFDRNSYLAPLLLPAHIKQPPLSPPAYRANLQEHCCCSAYTCLLPVQGSHGPEPLLLGTPPCQHRPHTKPQGIASWSTRMLQEALPRCKAHVEQLQRSKWRSRRALGQCGSQREPAFLLVNPRGLYSQSHQSSQGGVWNPTARSFQGRNSKQHLMVGGAKGVCVCCW